VHSSSLLAFVLLLALELADRVTMKRDLEIARNSAEAVAVPPRLGWRVWTWLSPRGRRTPYPAITMMHSTAQRPPAAGRGRSRWAARSIRDANRNAGGPCGVVFYWAVTFTRVACLTSDSLTRPPLCRY
jgi:hypothetical protein